MYRGLLMFAAAIWCGDQMSSTFASMEEEEEKKEEDDRVFLPLRSTSRLIYSPDQKRRRRRGEINVDRFVSRRVLQLGKAKS